MKYNLSKKCSLKGFRATWITILAPNCHPSWTEVGIVKSYKMIFFSNTLLKIIKNYDSNTIVIEIKKWQIMCSSKTN